MSLDSVARELNLWGSGLESIARDIRRGLDQLDGEELKGDEDEWVLHIAERIANIEELLKRVRLDLWQELAEAKLKEEA